MAEASSTSTSKTAVVKGFVQSDVKLNGKTVIITGANSGIGYETALDMARRGARVVMACRDLEKTEEAKAKILAEVSDGELIVRKLDLASFASIREFAKLTLENEARCDILINNAGIMMCPHWKTKDGFEMQFGVNYVGHFLLTDLLLHLIKKCSPSRIINVSSMAYKFGEISWNNINMESNYDPLKAYGQSKLANIHHCLAMSRRLEGTGVNCYCLHPGTVKTNLFQHLAETKQFSFKWKAILIPARPYLSLTSITPKQGAQTLIYCAVASELNNVTGKFYFKCAEVNLKSYASNKEDAARLWKLTEDLIQGVDHKSTEAQNEESNQVQEEPEGSDGK